MVRGPIFSATILLAALALGSSDAGGAYGQTSTQGTQDPATEPAPRGLEKVLLEVGEHSKLDPSRLIDALLAAGPRGWRELSSALRIDFESMDPSLRRSLLKAVAGVPREVLDHLAQGSLSARRGEYETTLALGVLEDFGAAGDLSDLVRLVTPERGEHLVPKLVRRAEQSLEAILRRDPATDAALELQFSALDGRCKPFVLRAVGSAATANSARFLADQLGLDPVLDLIALGQLGRVASEVEVELDERTRTWISMSLLSPDLALRREACLTLGKLELVEAIPDLIDLLSDPDAGIADNAHWALERISGKRLVADPGRWQNWLSEERLWWNTRAAGALESLHSDDPGTISKAIRELAMHRLNRNEVARELLSVLDHENDTLVAQTCGALAALRSRSSRGRLTGLLEHPSEAVRENARQALDALRDRP